MNNLVFNDLHYTELNTWLENKNPSKLFFLVDENTFANCLPLVLQEIATEIPIEILEIELGESNKVIETCNQLWISLLELGADRNSAIINIGGGVVTDLGGFLASTFMRGISFINIPTSLLAMVDASIGGKTGIDIENVKNAVGTFSLPELTIINSNFLQTLPNNQLKSGFAEMLKHALIADKNHWNELKNLKEISTENISPFIEKSVSIKKNIVEKDFKETGLRKTLNFGHTIGHAIESFSLHSKKPLLHGEAIAIGMYYETKLSHQKNMLSDDDYIEITSVITHFFSDELHYKFTLNDIISFMKNDKKNQYNTIMMSLLTEIGNCQIDCLAEFQSLQKIF